VQKQEKTIEEETQAIIDNFDISITNVLASISNLSSSFFSVIIPSSSFFSGKQKRNK